MKELFEQSCQSIDEAYRHLDHKLGYRFLLCPQKAFTEDARILFLALNPGGHNIVPEHPKYSCENGNAYFTESWKGQKVGTNKLQIQVQYLYDAIKKKAGSLKSTYDFSNSDIISAYFIPFRSKDISSLPQKKESVNFSKRLWANIFARWQPNSIIYLGKNIRKDILDVFVHCGYSITPPQEIKSGWGNCTLTVSFAQKGDVKIFVGGLLHLSRFPILGKPEYVGGVRQFIDMLYIQ